MEKAEPNTTKAHIQSFTNQKKCTTTQNKHKKLKRGLVASYNIGLEMEKGRLFVFQRFINMALIYLLRHLSTYLQPKDPHGANTEWLIWMTVDSRWGQILPESCKQYK